MTSLSITSTRHQMRSRCGGWVVSGLLRLRTHLAIPRWLTFTTFWTPTSPCVCSRLWLPLFTLSRLFFFFFKHFLCTNPPPFPAALPNCILWTTSKEPNSSQTTNSNDIFHQLGGDVDLKLKFLVFTFNQNHVTWGLGNHSWLIFFRCWELLHLIHRECWSKSRTPSESQSCFANWLVIALEKILGMYALFVVK